MNVEQYIESNCVTDGLAGLSRQIAKELFASSPTPLVDISAHVQIVGGGKLPYLQKPAGDAFIAAVDEFGRAPQLIHALRVLPQQVAVSYWYEHGRCGVPLAALPGTSPHERAIATDIQDHANWIAVLRKHNWIWRGEADPGHFSFHGPSDPDFGHYAIKAFQQLFNAHNSGNVVVDGNFGPSTQAALLQSPIEGWS